MPAAVGRGPSVLARHDSVAYPEWADFSKERKAELRGVKDPAKCSAENKIRNAAARAQPGYVDSKTLPGRAVKAAAQRKRTTASRAETQFNEIALQLAPFHDASLDVKRDVLEEMGLPYKKMFHCSPIVYATGPHPVIIGGLGIDNTCSIMTHQCHTQGPAPGPPLVWWNTSSAYAISKTLAQHPGPVRYK